MKRGDILRNKVKTDYVNILFLEDEDEKHSGEQIYENERILKGDNLYKNEQEEIMRKLILEEMINSLPPEDKEYVELLLQGYNIAEIGEIKGYGFIRSRNIYTKIIEKLQIRYRGMKKQGRRTKQ